MTRHFAMPADKVEEPSNPQKTVTLHLIPHTHDDVGWVKTIDEYFLGFSKTGGTSNVKQILDEVLQQLIADPNRRFTYTEMKFFTMWYTRLSAADKDSVKKVIKNG